VCRSSGWKASGIKAISKEVDVSVCTKEQIKTNCVNPELRNFTDTQIFWSVLVELLTLSELMFFGHAGMWLQADQLHTFECERR